MRRPTQHQYDRALEAYRANASPEEIARASGLKIEVVDRLIHDGWPAKKGRRPAPALKSFESSVTDRIYRTRNAELDWAQTTAETAGRAAAIRAKSVELAATIERGILMAWGKRIEKAMKDENATLPDFAAPKDLLASLRTLRWVREQAADVRVADLFRFLKGDEDSAKAGSEWEALIADLAEMTEEEQEHYAETGELPQPQLELAIPKTG
jgi:hypothetical protein